MSDSDFSNLNLNITTYSEDERYEMYLKTRQAEIITENLLRKAEYEKIFDEKKSTIFHLQGLNIYRFSEKKIKFSFQPSLLYEYISKKIIFYCSLRYLEKYRKWIIKREPIPARPIFNKVTSGSVFIDDDIKKISEIVIKIYKSLGRWSEKEIKYRRQKYERYCSGELCYMDIDSTDEELYFTEEEKNMLFEQRQTVLKRMLPPPPRRTKRKKGG